MKLKFALVMLATSITTGNLFAQGTNRALKIGDKVPEIRFKTMNHNKQDILLSEQLGKLVILDFWSTGCITCIRNFPKMDSLQAKFGDRIKIILVDPAFSRDDEKKVNRIFDIYTKNYGKPIGLSSTIQDTAAYNLFPHLAHPHIVVIDQQGNYKTATLNITEKDISNLVEHQDARLIFKTDIGGENSQTRLFSLDTTGIVYKSMFTGYLDSVSSSFRQKNDQRPSSPRTKTIRFINTTLLHLFQHVYHSFGVSRNRILFEGVPEEQFFKPSGMPANVWTAKNSCSYELIAANLSKREVLEQAKTDLRKYLGISASVEKRKIACWVVKMDETQYKHLLKGVKNIKAPLTLSEMIDANFRQLDIPVVGDTPYDLPVFKNFTKPEITFTDTDNTLEDLQQFVKENHLTLVKEDREQEVFVFTKIK